MQQNIISHSDPEVTKLGQGQGESLAVYLLQIRQLNSSPGWNKYTDPRLSSSLFHSISTPDFCLFTAKCKRASDPAFSQAYYIPTRCSMYHFLVLYPSGTEPRYLARERYHFHRSPCGQEAPTNQHLRGHFPSHWSWSNFEVSPFESL